MKNRADFVNEYVDIGQDFNAGDDWREVTGSLTFRYQNPKLQSLKQMTGSFEVDFWATSLASVIYFDDVKLFRQGR